MGAELGPKEPQREDPRTSFADRWNKDVARKHMSISEIQDARAAFDETEPTDLQVGIVRSIQAKKNDIATLDADLHWARAARDVYGRPDALTLWKKRDVTSTHDSENTAATESSNETEDRTEQQQLEELLSTGDTLAEARARINELSTQYKLATQSTNEAAVDFEGNHDGEAIEEVNDLFIKGRTQKGLEKDRKLLRTLLDHPEVSLQAAIEIYDSTREGE